MAEPKIDTDWNGEFLRLDVVGGDRVEMLRVGAQLVLSVCSGGSGRQVCLTAGQADDIATALASGAEIIRQVEAEDAG